MGVADKVRYNREMEHYQPSPEFLAQKASFDNANFGRDSLNDYFNYVNVNWKKVSVDRNMVNATDIQNFLWKEWCEKKSAPKKKPVKKVKPTGPFDLFKKELTEKLISLSPVPPSPTTMASLIDAKWAVLDESDKKVYEDRVLSK